MREQQHQVQAGIYCRLSKDDIGNGESSSIQSQKSILEKYVKDNGWQIFDYYVDDGYSGTNYNRPDFGRMIDDIENDKINMVLVKDHSRLGRNYLLTGQYTEIYFPDRGVRFVALNDGIDSLNADNDIAPFKNILNEMYSKDISKKVRSAVRAKKQRGEFVSNYAPYGYQKDPDNKNRLLVEESGAKIVRRMFEMCKSGMGSKAIANVLNQEKVLSPSNHRAELCKSGLRQQKNRWYAGTVISILRGRIYVGDMVQGVYECSRFRRNPHKRKSQDEWVITPNTHEPIVDLETWEHVQTLISSRKRVMRNGEVQLFAGFLKCEDCGQALSYAYCQGIEQYTCGQYRRYGREACSCHYIRKDTLVSVVLDDIRKHAKLARENEDAFAGRLALLQSGQEETHVRALESELKAAENRITELDRIMERLFEESALGGVSDKRFGKLSAKYEAEQEMLEKQILSIQRELESLKQSTKDTSIWLSLIKEYTDIQQLDRIMLTELIDKITVGEAKIIGGEKQIDVTIYYRFIGAIQ